MITMAYAFFLAGGRHLDVRTGVQVIENSVDRM